MSDLNVPFDHPWQEDVLGNVGSVVVGGTPRTSVGKYWHGDVPWMVSGDVHLKRITNVPARITELGLRSSNATLVDPPSVAVSLAGQGKTRGTVAFVLCRLCANQSVALIKCFPSCVVAEYLFYNLEFRYEELRSRSAGEGRAGLSKRILEQIPVSLPPLPHQAKIAEILSTIDRAIAQTKDLVDKQKRIKIGIMQNLLTRGIDEYGNLRSEKTHKFKDSPLGRIPEEWEIVKVDDIAEYVGSGITPRGGESVYEAHGVLFIRSQNVQFGRLELHDVAYIPERIHLMMRRSEVYENDVLLNITGASIGRCWQMPKINCRSNVNQHVCIIRLHDITEAKSGVLATIIESSIGQHQIARLNAGGNREGLNYQQVRSFLVPWPEASDEFGRLNGTMKALMDQINEWRLSLEKLHAIKAGLIKDLLSSRRRLAAP